MGLPFDPAISLPEISPKNPQTPIQKNLCIPMFIAAIYTIAKCWKQTKCPSVDEWIKKLVYLHNGILCNRKKEKGTPTPYNSMYGTGDYYAKSGVSNSFSLRPHQLCGCLQRAKCNLSSLTVKK
ncbi:hypothetical protein HJG60_007919 [Phyllostomus discolor]|uniref:Uncharacterized protein n=1 Tax=Phyllostomus discolor TaxID=89673 RepID=A0A834BE31_9CHIR|nr:hypothetical protein HJG60_007919 [Phyllostomus discolor]